MHKLSRPKGNYYV